MRIVPIIAVVLLVAFQSLAQVPAPPPPQAVKLPDGAIVVFAKSATEALAAVPDGVLLSAADYTAIQQQIEAFKQSKANEKAVPPSRCDLRAKIVRRGERFAALLTATYTIRTTAASSTIALGGSRAFPIRAKYVSGETGTPILLASADGLTVRLDRPGERVLTVEYEAAVAPRGPKNDPGFEIGLPKAALTTLAVELPEGVRRLAVGTPGDKVGETKWTSDEAGVWAVPGLEPGRPLGPVESVEATWEVPKPAGPMGERPLTADVEISIRVDDVRIETTAKFRLKGTAVEWALALPASADVMSERSSGIVVGIGTLGENAPTPGLTRPTDAAKPVWLFRPPDPTADWLVTAVVRTARPMPNDPKHRGPYAIGPFLVPAAIRQTGTVRVFAPPTVRVTLEKPTLDLRRVDVIPGGEEEPTTLLRYTAVTAPGAIPADFPPLVELTTRPLPGFVRVNPSHTLRRTETGWKLTTEAKVTPVRSEVDQLLIDVPAGWQSVEASAVGELIDEVQVVSETPTMRRLAIRLIGPQRAAFDVALSAVFPGPLNRRKDDLALPRFANTTETQAKLLAVVPEGLEAAGNALSDEPNAVAVPLLPTTVPDERRIRPGAARAVAAKTDKAFSRVELTWQPYRPELMVDVRAEIVWQERQAVVTQTTRLKIADGDPRPIPFRGAVLGLRVLPPLPGAAALPGTLEPVDRDSWQLRVPAEAPRDFTFTVVYAVPVPPRGKAGEAATLPFPLWLPETATKCEGRIRVWNGGASRRPVRWIGPWRELPPLPAAERDQLPWLTLAAAGESLPLSWELEEINAELPGTIVERGLVQTWVGGDGRQFTRARWVLKRWNPSGLEVEVRAGFTPECWIDGRRTDALPGSTSEGDLRLLRFPIPELKPGRTLLLVEVRGVGNDGTAPRGEISFAPPRLPGAAWRTPLQRQFFLPPDLVPLFLGNEATAEQRWTWSNGLFRPVAPGTTADADAKLMGAADDDLPPESNWMAPPADPNSTIAFRGRGDASPFRLWLLPAAAWFALCSLPVVVVGVAVGVRLRPAVLGLLLALLGGLLAVGIAFRPQLATQVLVGLQPGVVGLTAILSIAALVRRRRRRRVEYLPGFTRTPPALLLPPLSTTSHAADAAGSARLAISNAVLLDAPQAQSSLRS